MNPFDWLDGLFGKEIAFSVAVLLFVYATAALVGLGWRHGRGRVEVTIITEIKEGE